MADATTMTTKAVKKAQYVWAQRPGADFADCLLTARAAHLGRSRFLSFDAGANRPPGVEQVAKRAADDQVQFDRRPRC